MRMIASRPTTIIALITCFSIAGASQQETQTDAVQHRIDQLSSAIDAAQKQIQASQRQLDDLKHQLSDLQQISSSRPSTSQTAPSTSQAAHAPETTAAVSDLAEKQTLQESQLATLDASKVETTSKYPLKLSGMILLNGFVNTGSVDDATAPTIALGGDGSTGLSLRQTVLGFDARGPHLAGAASRADLRVDFFGSSAKGNYGDRGGLLRLRTAHASLDWKHVEVFGELDRTILNPNSPSSLTSVAQPELAWSGNLWSWNPQAGITQTFGNRIRWRWQAAVIDPNDPNPTVKTAAADANLAERSFKPGVEARVALLGRDDAQGLQIGVGGYFSPHRTLMGDNFDAWAMTLDYRLSLWAKSELTGSLYRGQALGGLGGGGSKDYVYQMSVSEAVAPRDAGGWLQLKQRFNERMESNTGFGLDNVFATDLRRGVADGAGLYGSVARNRTIYTNLIYSPSSYLLFSTEYRRLTTNSIAGPVSNSNVFGLGMGYRF